MSAVPRVRIGNQTAYKAAYPALPFEYALARGFDAFEWFPDRRPDGRGWAAADLGVAERRSIRDIARDQDIALSVHAKLPADPLHPSAEIFLADGLRLAEDLGATLLNIHLSQADTPARYAEVVRPWASRCARAAIRLALENTPADGPEDANIVFAHLDDFAGAVGMCLDIGHANLYPPTRNDYLSYFDRLAPNVEIIHMHVHENFGDLDSHLPPFCGPSEADPSGLAGIVERLKRREFRGNLIIEQWPDSPALLDRARVGLREMFESA